MTQTLKSRASRDDLRQCRQGDADLKGRFIGREDPDVLIGEVYPRLNQCKRPSDHFHGRPKPSGQFARKGWRLA